MTDIEKIFQLKKRWDSDEDDIGLEVFSPCLKLAKFYRAQTGFLRERVLDKWAPALISLVQKEDIKIQILCSPDISHYITDVLSETLTEEEKKAKLAEIGDNAVLAALGLTNAGEEKEKRNFRQVVFAYLIASKKLEIKLAMMESVNLNDDLFHYKRGYFIFDDERVIAHEGSGNLTSQGLGEQGNFLNLYKSTDEGHHEDITDIRNKVDSHWDEKNNRVRIIPLDKKTLDIIKKSSEQKTKQLNKDLKDRIEEKEGGTTPTIVIPKNNKPEIVIPEYINYKKGKWWLQKDIEAKNNEMDEKIKKPEKSLIPR